MKVLVIGSGPGGYVAAIRCAQLGMQVELAERFADLGGTCTNVGCIPSKALLDSTEHYHNARKNFKRHGIAVEGLAADWPAMLKRKDKVVKLSSKGIRLLLEQNGVRVHQGIASFIEPGRLRLKADQGETELAADRVIVASGSRAMDLPFARIDGRRILGSTELLSLPEVPESLLIIGAGAIGLELGSVFARLGTKVRVFEVLERALPTMDHDLGTELERSLKRLGLKLHLQHQVLEVEAEENSVRLLARDPGGTETEHRAQYCLMATGRRPCTEGLELERLGLETDARGFIPVDEGFQSAVPGVYAVGDVIGGLMLAHKAEDEGVCLAERLAGREARLNYGAIPGVVYTWPEAASVGASEQELKESGRAYRCGRFPFAALGRARAAEEKEGLAKVLAEEDGGRLLGIHIIGPRAADMIGEAAAALEHGLSAAELAAVCHPHPSFSEALKEACLATEERAIHL